MSLENLVLDFICTNSEENSKSIMNRYYEQVEKELSLDDDFDIDIKGDKYNEK